MSDPSTHSDGTGSPVPGADHVIDATGLVCPEPLMVVRNRMRELAGGETLRVLATDPSTARDIPQYCRFVHHELLYAVGEGDRFEFVIRKGTR